MRSKEEIEWRIQEIKGDSRYSYPPVLVQINAPLALEQVAMKCKVQALEWVLEGG